ncbi:MAG: nuclear transport factor 2 family protein [Thermodesulfobacteriota bacterium]
MHPTRQTSSCYCVAIMGSVLGLISFFGTAEQPEQAVGEFVKLFNAGNAESIRGLFHPDIVSGKDLRTDDIQGFLRRMRSQSARLKGFQVTERLRSEDGKTERFQAALSFDCDALGQYPERPTLEMALQWVLEKGKWWLERTLSVQYRVTSNKTFPTAEQSEAAMEFQAAVQVLDGLGDPASTSDVPFAAKTVPGSAIEAYKELEGLYKQERGKKGGVDSRSRGVSVLLKGAAHETGGLLSHYYGDFKTGPSDKRRPVPWEMFREYAEAAIEHGKSLERRGQIDKAEVVYKRLVSLGRQFASERGGFYFLSWGIAFQKLGAQELERLMRVKGDPQIRAVQEFVSLCTRRLDLLSTALGCLDDMSDYKALNAAVLASQRLGDPVFRPWGLNTLAILAIKGAPADRKTIESAGAMVVILNPHMQRLAMEEMNKLSAGGSSVDRIFIDQQKKWAANHEVYGETSGVH